MSKQRLAETESEHVTVRLYPERLAALDRIVADESTEAGNRSAALRHAIDEADPTESGERERYPPWYPGDDVLRQAYDVLRDLAEPQGAIGIVGADVALSTLSQRLSLPRDAVRRAVLDVLRQYDNPPLVDVRPSVNGGRVVVYHPRDGGSGE